MMISIRWFADLYRASILGVEQQIWLNGVSIIMATLQYGGGYVLLRWFTHMPSHFFEYQLLVATIELAILGIKSYKIFQISLTDFLNFNMSWKSLRKVLPFASGVFYSSIIWTLLTQLDKIVLSHMLPLSTYGYFALVTVISWGILQVVSPISQAVLPRMTSLLSQENKIEMLQVYRDTTQIVTAIMLPLAGIVAIYGTQIVYIWTGDRIAANWAGPVLFWYALGNGILSISSFQYYLQFAHGNLKLHIVFNTLLAIIAIPLIFFSAYYYSAIGTAIAWFLIQTISFLIWPPIIHRKYAPGIHYEWLVKDIFPTLIIVVVMLAGIKMMPINFGLMNRYESFTIIAGFTMAVLTASVLASSTCRHFLVACFQALRSDFG
jgi:O-antigen/teichoic acid export membrane protein